MLSIFSEVYSGLLPLNLSAFVKEGLLSPSEKFKENQELKCIMVQHTSIVDGTLILSMQVFHNFLCVTVKIIT